MVNLVKDFKKEKTKVKEYWHMLGPGLTTGAADDDPSGITTYSQAGAVLGYKMLWTALVTFPFMAVVQEMCARIGIVTGRGLASNIRLNFPRWVLYLTAILLLVANTFNIAANLAMMSEATKLLLPWMNLLVLVVLFTLGSLWMQIVLSYKRYARYLKWLAVFLGVYVVAAFSVKINWAEAIPSTLLPDISFSKNELLLLTAVLGTTISPYLFFWQTSQEVEEQILEGKTTIKQRAAITTPADVKKMRTDVWTGMFLSNLVMYFIIAVCASTLHQSGITGLTSAREVAEALKPLAGNAAYLFFTLGIIGTGLLSVPVLAGSSSYAISESFGWREGLYRKFKQAHAFYGVIIFSMLVGVAINFLKLDAVKMLIYSAVLNGLIAPFILLLIVLLASKQKLMNQWVNRPATTFVGFLIVLLMTGVAILTIISL
ncbi:MAG: divalent metal cation transporter [Candidatus Doudnabacteria bacterium]|nr:divalent metal cation transporter [Candidatus Doudnabacteria bacterium]